MQFHPRLVHGAAALALACFAAVGAHAAAPQIKTQAPGYYRVMLGEPLLFPDDPHIRAIATDDPGRFATNPPSIKLCIGFHEEMVAPMFGRPWRLEDEASKADFIIESERWRCAKHLPVIVVDELKRFGLPFARVLARQPADIAAATSALP